MSDTNTTLTEEELPPLPEPDEKTRHGLAFSGFAVRESQRQAIAAYQAKQAETAQPVGMEDGPAGSGGWKNHAESLEKEMRYWRTRVQTMYEHQSGQAWYWQGDGNDHIESMVNSLPVVITAGDLRDLITPPTHSALLEAAKKALDALFDIEASGRPVLHIDSVIAELGSAIEACNKSTNH